MKKYIACLFCLIASFTKANAQLFVGGTFGAEYRYEVFNLKIKPSVGYEFNDRWAVGLGLGMAVVEKEVLGLVNPYVRFNCWNNNKFFIDAKASAEIGFKNEYSQTLVGLMPSMRYAINDNWQFVADVGVFGVDIIDGEVKPAIGLTVANVELTIVYKF